MMFRPNPASPTIAVSAVQERASYDLAWLDHDGLPQWQSRLLPVSPITESACAAIAHGGLIETDHGQKSIEDLNPGDNIRCADGTVLPLRWIGSRTYSAHLEPAARPRLLRVTGGTFGRDAPNRDTVLARSATVLLENPACEQVIGQRAAFAPLAAFEDGLTISRLTPPGDLTLYNLAFDRQQAILVNGLAVETYHPGRNTMQFVNNGAQTTLSRLFPHICTATGFGPASIPGLSITEARMLDFAQAS